MDPQAPRASLLVTAAGTGNQLIILPDLTNDFLIVIMLGLNIKTMFLSLPFASNHVITM